jgi:Eukaryotic aspartyl protease
MTVVLDTGSSDLWIPGDGCTLCGLHNTFDSSASSSYRPARQNGLGPPREFEIDYGSGAVAGTVAVESVILGGLLLDPVTFGEVRLLLSITISLLIYTKHLLSWSIVLVL